MRKVPRYQIVYMEYERGWGNRVDEIKYFPATPRGKAEAERLVKEFNSKNTSSKVPDWYMTCHGPDLVEIDLDDLKKK